MSLPQEINFRSTANFRNTDSSDAYIQVATSANYPTTTSQGNDVGWETSGVEGAINSHNNGSGVDVRLAGDHFNDPGRTYRIDLPSSGLDIRIRISGGDHDYASNFKCEVFDNTTSKGVIADQAVAQHGCVDAQDVEHTEANWPANNDWSDTISMSSAILKLTFAAVDYWAIMHIRVEEVSSGASISDVNLRAANRGIAHGLNRGM